MRLACLQQWRRGKVFNLSRSASLQGLRFENCPFIIPQSSHYELWLQANPSSTSFENCPFFIAVVRSSQQIHIRVFNLSHSASLRGLRFEDCPFFIRLERITRRLVVSKSSTSFENCPFFILWRTLPDLGARH